MGRQPPSLTSISTHTKRHLQTQIQQRKSDNMPKNKGKGGKNRRRGKNENDNEKRELTFKQEGLDQPRRHHLAFAPRLPRREGRRDPQVQRGRSSLPESVRRAARERKDQRDGYIWPRRRRRLQLRVR